MELRDLISEDEYRCAMPLPSSVPVCAVVRDTAAIVPDCLFVCIRGTRYDTHARLPEIAAAGAAAVVVEIGSSFERIPGLPILEVSDTRRIYSRLWDRFCHHPTAHMRVWGITGTNGKTSTAYMLSWILREKRNVALLGTVEARIGDRIYTPASADREGRNRFTTMTTPDPELLYPFFASGAKEGVTDVVMEVSSHALAQYKLDPVRFFCAGFTGLSPEHLDFHKTMEEYAHAKAILFSKSQQSVLLSDAPYASYMEMAAAGPVFRTGPGEESEITDIRNRADGVSFSFRYRRQITRVDLPVAGAFSARNASLAMRMAMTDGITPAEAAARLRTLPQIPGRLERLSLKNCPFTVYIDYAHTERAMRTVLSELRNMTPAGGRLIAVFGCGGNRDRTKRPLMGRAANDLCDFSIVTSDNSRQEDPEMIISEILSGMPDKERLRVIVRRKEAIAYAVRTARSGDVIVLLGKGHERYEIDRNGMHPFDERKLVLEAVAAQGGAL